MFLGVNNWLVGQNGTAVAIGARSLGLGGAAVTFSSVNSVFSNQAGLVGIRNTSYSINSEQRFLLNEIRAVSAAVAHSFGKTGTLGLGVQYFGFSAYNEQRISLGYGRKLGDNFAIGTSLIWSNTAIPEYGNKGVFTFDIGMMAYISPKVSLGVEIFNPLRVKITDDESLPAVLKIGFLYRPSKVVRIMAEVEKDIQFGLRTHWGAEYDVLKQLVLRFGLTTRPAEFSFGFGYKVKDKLRIDVAASYHQVLGVTPALSIVFQSQIAKPEAKRRDW